MQAALAPNDTRAWLGKWIDGGELSPEAARNLSLDDALALAARLSDLGRHDRKDALECAEAFVLALQSHLDPTTRAVARRARAHALRGLQRHREALTDYRVALRAFESSGLSFEAARTAIGLVDVLAHLGRISDARQLAARAHRVFLRAGEPRRAARLEVNLANLELRLDRRSQALSRYASAERVFQQLDHPLDLALTRFNRANALVELGRLRDALPLLASSADLWASADMHASVGQCQIAHADVLFRLGRVSPALTMLDDARRLAGPLGDRLLEAMAEAASGRVALAARLHEEARTALDAAVGGYAQLGMAFDEGEARLLRAALYARLGRRSAATDDLDHAEECFRAAGNVSRLHEILLVRTRLLGEAVTPAVRDRIQRSLPTLRRLGLVALEAEARIVLATYLFDRGDAAAELHRKRARTLLSRSAEPTLSWRLALLDARMAGRHGRVRSMANALERAAGLTDALARAMPTELLRAGLSAERSMLEDWAVGLWLESSAEDRVIRALRWSDRAHVPRMAWVDEPEQGSRRDAIAEAVAERRAELDALDTAPEAGTRSPALSRRRAKVVSDLQRLLGQLERDGNRLQRQRTAEFDIARLPQAVDERECLVEYFVGRDDIHAFAVSRAGVEHIPIDTRPEVIHGHAFRLRRLFERRRLESIHSATVSATLDETERRLMKSLHEALMAPVLRACSADISTLTVVPHRWLRSVPFHGFPGVDGAVMPVRYMLSARDRLPQSAESGSDARCSGHGGRGGLRVLVVGVASVDAPEAEQEAKDVAALHPGATLLLGDAATREAVAAHWADADVVHLAAHGGLELDEPRLSGVRLGRGSWTALDIAERRTRARLVVLSACRTGEIVLWGGDEAFGLVPALFRVGVASAIVSLWPVRDADAHSWMQQFHRHLASGADLMSAWLEAVGAVRSMRRSAYHWAPFAHYAGPLASVNSDTYFSNQDRIHDSSTCGGLS